MRLKRGKSVYTIAGLGIWQSALVVQGGFSTVLCRIGHQSMRAQKENHPEVLGFPTCVRVDEFNQEFELFPAPDKNYTMKIRYYPQMVEK
jgi:hypothetical protein